MSMKPKINKAHKHKCVCICREAVKRGIGKIKFYECKICGREMYP
jgi:hypothetical protein